MLVHTLLLAQRTPPRASSSPHTKPERAIRVWLDTFSAGRLTVAATSSVFVHMHVGRSVNVHCLRGGVSRHGHAVPGDLEIIPAHAQSAWEFSSSSARLIVQLSETLLQGVAVDLGMTRGSVEIADRFQLRDPVIEHIGWALKADMDSGAGRSRIQESLATALAIRLLQRHNIHSLPMRGQQGRMSAAKLRQVLAYIDENLATKLSLAKISRAAGTSASHLQALFRNATGLSIHQYVLRRRIEHAQLLLQDRKRSISQVALACGFAHQSHLARHMRRIFGTSPMDFRRNSKD